MGGHLATEGHLGVLEWLRLALSGSSVYQETGLPVAVQGKRDGCVCVYVYVGAVSVLQCL